MLLKLQARTCKDPPLRHAPGTGQTLAGHQGQGFIRLSSGSGGCTGAAIEGRAGRAWRRFTGHPSAVADEETFEKLWLLGKAARVFWASRVHELAWGPLRHIATPLRVLRKLPAYVQSIQTDFWEEDDRRTTQI